MTKYVASTIEEDRAEWLRLEHKIREYRRAYAHGVELELHPSILEGLESAAKLMIQRRDEIAARHA